MTRPVLTQNPHLEQLSRAGVSVWFDDLSRDLLDDDKLQELMSTRSVVGVTTNPSIFQAAMSKGHGYDSQIRELAAARMSGADAVHIMTIQDVQRACDILDPVFQQTNGLNGRVSIEVDPFLAHDAAATEQQALDLWNSVDRANLMIKIPATKEGIPAIQRVIGHGISVNSTLIFSVKRYAEVMGAYLDGLSTAAGEGLNLSKIHSVASFFVSRVDTEIDKRLEAIGTQEALQLRGKSGIANAQLAYAAYQEAFEVQPWFPTLQAQGAVPQRPLWASTSTKNPTYNDVMYIEQLIAPGTVNTIPAATLEAFADHGKVTENTCINPDGANEVFEQLTQVGIDLDDVFEVLELDGVKKFQVAWQELLHTTTGRLYDAVIASHE